MSRSAMLREFDRLKLKRVASKKIHNTNPCYETTFYQVQVRNRSVQVDDPVLGNLKFLKHIKVRRKDGGADIPWNVLQAIKNELCGPHCTGVEVFPPEEDKVDRMNVRHLWVFDSDYKLPFGLNKKKRPMFSWEELFEQ